MKQKVLMVMLAVSLWGCNQDKSSDSITEAPTEQRPTAEAVVKQAMESKPAETTMESRAEAEKEAKKTKPKLNLAIPTGGAVSDSNPSSVALMDSDEPKMLRNMFEASDKGTKVGGGLLRDEENEDYLDSVQGAQVNVEFKTN